MRPVTLTTLGVSISTPCLLDWRNAPFNVGIAVIVTGTATYNVEVSYEAPPVNWIVDANFSAKAATAAGPINVVNGVQTPCQYVRVNQTAGSGSTSATVVSAGL